MAGPSSARVVHALAHVKRLPRKASRLVCLVDPSAGTSPQDQFFPVDYGGASRSSDSSSGGSSGYYSGCSSSETEASSSSSSSQSVTPAAPPTAPAHWNPGPIITREQLEAALSRTSLVLEDAADAPPTRTPTPAPTPRPRVTSKSLSIKIPYDSGDPSSLSFPSAEPRTSVPDTRPLSPPPDHFRRRVGSGNVSVAGATPFASPFVSPIATPVHSPPGSPNPCLEFGGGRRPIALHEVLSSESLVAPPLRLYRPDADDAGDGADGEMPSLYTSSVRFRSSRSRARPRAGGEEALRRMFSR